MRLCCLFAKFRGLRRRLMGAFGAIARPETLACQYWGHTMKLSKLLVAAEHLGFVEAHDPPGLISRPDGFRVKTRQAWAAALRERKPGNRRVMSTIQLAEAESRRIAALERQLDEAYARGRRRAMEPAPEYVSRIPGAVPEKRMVTRGFRTVRNGLKQDEWDAIPVKSA